MSTGRRPPNTASSCSTSSRLRRQPVGEGLEGHDPSVEDIRTALRHGTLEGICVPILNGSAFKNKGVQPMLDAVVDFLPSPIDLPPTQGTKPGKDEVIERKPSDDEPFAASPSRSRPTRTSGN